MNCFQMSLIFIHVYLQNCLQKKCRSCYIFRTNTFSYLSRHFTAGHSRFVISKMLCVNSKVNHYFLIHVCSLFIYLCVILQNLYPTYFKFLHYFLNCDLNLAFQIRTWDCFHIYWHPYYLNDKVTFIH